MLQSMSFVMHPECGVPNSTARRNFLPSHGQVFEEEVHGFRQVFAHGVQARDGVQRDVCFNQLLTEPMVNGAGLGPVRRVTVLRAGCGQIAVGGDAGDRAADPNPPPAPERFGGGIEGWPGSPAI